MAVLTRFTCITCRKNVEESRSSSDYSLECYSCKVKVANKKEREWKSGREGLTLEERIRDLENFMYNHKDASPFPTVYG